MATESENDTKDGLQPGHDIFYTPANASFYATKPYSQLNPAQQEVRLLRLLPYPGQGLIECELLEATPILNIKGQYTALSYCAGSPRETDVILLDGVRFNVFASLGHALKQIRNFWDQTFPDRECIVWIDQICINQNDIEERSHQVRFMREIYEYSEQVLACLLAENTEPKGMDWLLEIVKCEGRDIFKLTHPSFWCHLQDTKYVEGWVAFYDIVETAWWKRAWVFQEFIVAPALYFIYGTRFVSWEDFKSAFASVFSAHSKILELKTKLQALNRSKLEVHNLELLVQRSAGGGSDAINKGHFMVTSKILWSGSMDLKKLLNHARYCESSDPRDKVFAFLGLADTHYGILPDYSQTLAQVLTETAMKLIICEDSLDILCIAASSNLQRTNNLGSWIVDWACEEETAKNKWRLLYTESALKTNRLNRKNANASFCSLATPSGKLVALKLRGVLIDVIKSITSYWCTPPSYSYMSRSSIELTSFPYYCWCRSYQGYAIITNNSLQSGDQVWILDGAGLPLILRTQGDSRYSLISNASIAIEGKFPKHNELHRLLDIALNDQGGWQTVFVL